MAKIVCHTELRVYKLSFELAMEIYELTKTFPREEMYSLTDQIRRSSRSVSGNIAEAWRKRRYPKSFVAKLSDSDGEAAETQVWLEYAFGCNYISQELFNELNTKYNHLLGMLVTMMINPDKWSL